MNALGFVNKSLQRSVTGANRFVWDGQPECLGCVAEASLKKRGDKLVADPEGTLRSVIVE